jgi:hypothetical protein
MRADGGSTFVHLGDERLNLRAAADAAVELAHLVEKARVRHLHLAERDANAALRRRFPIP